jgi:hypothetical protein
VADGLTQARSRSFGEALTPVTALKIAMGPIERLALSELSWSRIYSKWMQMAFLEKEAREHEFLTASATDRYLDLIRSEPRQLETVSLQTLATFLDITPVALSRIRGRIHQH